MFFAPVAKLVDALDLGSSVLRRVGSSPIGRTTKLPKCSSDESTTLRKFCFRLYRRVLKMPTILSSTVVN